MTSKEATGSGAHLVPKRRKKVMKKMEAKAYEEETSGWRRKARHTKKESPILQELPVKSKKKPRGGRKGWHEHIFKGRGHGESDPVVIGKKKGAKNNRYEERKISPGGYSLTRQAGRKTLLRASVIAKEKKGS